MKSVSRFGLITWVSLAFLIPGAAIKIQAQTDVAPKCVLAAVRDFNVVTGPGQALFSFVLTGLRDQSPEIDRMV